MIEINGKGWFKNVNRVVVMVVVQEERDHGDKRICETWQNHMAMASPLSYITDHTTCHCPSLSVFLFPIIAFSSRNVLSWHPVSLGSSSSNALFLDAQTPLSVGPRCNSSLISFIGAHVSRGRRRAYSIWPRGPLLSLAIHSIIMASILPYPFQPPPFSLSLSTSLTSNSSPPFSYDPIPFPNHQS
ncbi:hypothetical protein VNO80_04695 [Phaseolus coccineus]|uniref:Uncharacterized protein n=1 Tax=Phaseolus coccineus TaxID=3886 RepID=A0AAN9NVD2_PHACN